MNRCSRRAATASVRRETAGSRARTRRTAARWERTARREAQGPERSAPAGIDLASARRARRRSGRAHRAPIRSKCFAFPASRPARPTPSRGGSAHRARDRSSARRWSGAAPEARAGPRPAPQPIAPKRERSGSHGASGERGSAGDWMHSRAARRIQQLTSRRKRDFRTSPGGARFRGQSAARIFAASSGAFACSSGCDGQRMPRPRASSGFGMMWKCTCFTA